jgi:hypothetical protein
MFCRIGTVELAVQVWTGAAPVNGSSRGKRVGNQSQVGGPQFIALVWPELKPVRVTAITSFR